MSRIPRSNMPVLVMAAAAFAAIPAASIVYALKLAGTLPDSPPR